MRLFLVIILTAVTLHTIFHANTSLLDKYYEKDMCNYKHKIFNGTWDCRTMFSHLAIEGM